MVRADIIDFIDRVLRIYTKNMRTPFGGKQMLFVGDVYQLEPVVPPDQRQILSKFYTNPFFFSAKVFAEMALITIELRKVYRQNDDVFIKILDKIRVNSSQKNDLELLNNRYNPDFVLNDNDFIITIATKRDTVDFINNNELKKLESESFMFKGDIRGEFPESGLPTPLEIGRASCRERVSPPV